MDSTFTFRVDAALKKAFEQAAKSNDRSGSQLLRDFMREYVQRSNTARPVISAAERKQREDAITYARASVGLEGFKLSTADEYHASRFINGEINLAEFVKTRNEQL